VRQDLRATNFRRDSNEFVLDEPIAQNFRQQRWKHDNGRLVSHGCQTDMQMQQLAEFEDQIAEREAIEAARAQQMMKRWKLGAASRFFGIWKGVAGGDDVAQVTEGLKEGENDQCDQGIKIVTDVLQTATSAPSVARAFHVWEAYTSVMLDARRVLDNELTEEVKLLLFLQREIALDLFSTMEMHELAEKLASQAKKIIRVQHCFMVSISSSSGELELCNPHEKPPQVMPSEPSLVLKAAENLFPIQVQDVSSDPRWNLEVEGSLAPNAQNAMFVPMANHGVVCGVLMFVNKSVHKPGSDQGSRRSSIHDEPQTVDLEPKVSDPTEHNDEIDSPEDDGVSYTSKREFKQHGFVNFTKQDEKMTESFTAQASIAVTNAQLYQERKKAERRMQALVDMVHDLTGELDLQALMKTVVEHACHICGAKASALYLLNEERDKLELNASFGEIGDSLPSNPESGSPEWQAVQRAEAEDFPHIMYQPMLPMGASSEEVVGVLIVKDKETGKFFTEEDSSMLELYCQQAAVNVVNVQQYNIAQSAQDQQQELERASLAAASIALDTESSAAQLPTFAAMAAQAAEGLLTGRTAQVYMLEGQNLVSIKPGETEFKKHGDTRAGIIGHVLQQLEHYWCPSTLEDDLFDPKIDCCKGSSSNALICHPLEVEGCGCIGAIQVIRDNNDNFTPLEIKLLKLYSVKVAATLGVQQLHLSSEMYRTQCTTLAEVWSGTVEPVESISRLIMNTCKVVGADFALYYQQENVDPKGVSTLQLVEMHVEQHVESTTLPQANVPLAGCLLGKTVTTGRSVVGIVHELEGFNAVFDTLPDVQVTAVLMVPVKRPDMSVMGVVYAGKVAVGKHQRNMGFVEDDLQKVVLMCGLLAQLTSWRQLQDDMYKIEDQCTRLSDLVSFLCNTNSKRQDHEIQLRQMVRLAKEAVGAEVAMLHITLGKMPPRDEITVDVPLKVKKRCEICVVSRELANDDDEEGAQRQGSATEVCYERL